MATMRDASGDLTLGGVRLAEIADDPRIGTPTYVYDVDAIAAESRALKEALAGEGAASSPAHLVAYAVKANAAGPIVRAVVAEGCGADVVSAGELELALLCGAQPEQIVFSGVAKTDAELAIAIGTGASGIGAIQAESADEIARIDARAREANRIARVSIRFNPELERDSLATHRHIATGHDEAKFGIARADLPEALARIDAAGNVRLVGITAHVGSQLTDVRAYVDAARALFAEARALRDRYRASFTFVDTGGGFGIDYGDGCPVTPADFVRATLIAKREAGLADLALHVEPGRSLVAAHGVLLARAIGAKNAIDPATGAVARRWRMIDAGMNDLLRPALYQARHRIVSLREGLEAPRATYRVVGPVCESSDDFGDFELPVDANAFAILDAGAYGYSMASRYNGRALAAEVFVRGGHVVAVSPRRALAEWARERAAIGE